MHQKWIVFYFDFGTITKLLTAMAITPCLRGPQWGPSPSIPLRLLSVVRTVQFNENMLSSIIPDAVLRNCQADNVNPFWSDSYWITSSKIEMTSGLIFKVIIRRFSSVRVYSIATVANVCNWHCTRRSQVQWVRTNGYGHQWTWLDIIHQKSE